MISIEKHQMKPTFLTNQLMLKASNLPVGTTVEITEKAIFQNQLYFALNVPSLAVQQDNYLLKACIDYSADKYCLIGYPQKIDDEAFKTALIVLKVVSTDSLVTISEEELRQIMENCQQALAAGSVSLDDATSVFGQFQQD